VVEFDGPDDPLHAQNWSIKKKLITAAILGFTTLTSAFGSSIFSAATRVVAKQYGVGDTVGVLGTSLYVLVRPSNARPDSRQLLITRRDLRPDLYSGHL
jgi:DHA1 family multidrug resistance protein-like MFS transporter